MLVIYCVHSTDPQRAEEWVEVEEDDLEDMSEALEEEGFIILNVGTV